MAGSLHIAACRFFPSLEEDSCPFRTGWPQLAFNLFARTCVTLYISDPMSASLYPESGPSTITAFVADMLSDATFASSYFDAEFHLDQTWKGVLRSCWAKHRLLSLSSRQQRAKDVRRLLAAGRDVNCTCRPQSCEVSLTHTVASSS